MNKRAFLIVLDSFGIGAAQDAAPSDVGSNTLAHIAEHTSLNIPNLCQLGLNESLKMSCGEYGKGLPVIENPTGQYGYAVEQSVGKDTPSGHWEMAGLPVLEDWGYFNNGFPEKLIADFIEQAKVPGVLGLCHASGTEIIKELGEEHVTSGKPIVYTSADSVFQIAAHEEAFGLERLYEICEIARKLVDQYNIGRVIARPFVGDDANSFVRTCNRRDLATPPFDKTLLDRVVDSGKEVISIGKVSDIFAHCGISQSIKTKDNDDGFQKLLLQAKAAPPGSLVFANLNDFDTQFGHRRNIEGYAQALEQFDKQLPEFIGAMQADDIAILAADHGCDPSWQGSDHTREHIPVIAFGPGLSPKNIGRRETFADIGQTIASHLNLKSLTSGEVF